MIRCYYYPLRQIQIQRDGIHPLPSYIDVIFTARRYASAVLAVVVCPSVCPSVCLSVCHKPVLYRNGNT